MWSSICGRRDSGLDEGELPMRWDITKRNDTNRKLERQRSDYKPTALKWPFLTALFAVLLTTTTFLSYTVCTLPVVGTNTERPSPGAGSKGLDATTVLPWGDAGKTVAVMKDVGSRRRIPINTPVETLVPSKTDTATRAVYTSRGSALLNKTFPAESESIDRYQADPTCCFTGPQEDYGNVGDQVVTESPPSSLRSTNHGDTVTQPPATTQVILPIGDYGIIGHQTITVSTTNTEPTPGFTETVIETAIRTVTEDVISTSMETIVYTPPPLVPSRTISDPNSDGHYTTITLGFLLPPPVSFQPTDNYGVGNSYSTKFVLTLTNTLGLPAATSTVSRNLAPSLFLTTPTNEAGQPTATQALATMGVPLFLLTTLTDDAGRPTATQVLADMATPSLSFTTLINTTDQPTATQVLTIMPTPSISEETTSTSHSSLIATIESNPIPSGIHTVVYHISQKEYFVGMFLPTIITSIIAKCVRIIITNATIFQPWHALAQDHGASGRDSLWFQTGGWQSVIMSIQSLWLGQMVVFSTSLLLLFSAVLIPISAEAVTLDLMGDGCQRGATTAKNCAWVLSASAPASKAAIALLVLMGVIVLALFFLLGRWRLGVHTNPWGICTLASLSLNEEIRQLVAVAGESPRGRNRRFLEALRFKLGYFQHINGKREYGLIVLDDLDSTESRPLQRTEVTVAREDKSHNRNLSNTQRGMPFFFLGYFGRLILLGFVCGVLVLILYYSQTGGDTAFERFLDEDSFGVRFLFTSFGVAISFFWGSFYRSITVATQYQLLATRPQSATRSILLAPPTNALSGFWYAARTRSGFLATAGLASVLSEFLGIFLSNVPFQVTQTFLVSQISIWTSVGILSFMVLVIVISFYVKWPHMPADPSTIAGAIYYIHNSSMPDRFEGLSTLNRKERDQKVTELALLYELGTIKSVLGAPTVSVDIYNKG